jgi:hypothetical protein
MSWVIPNNKEISATFSANHQKYFVFQGPSLECHLKVLEALNTSMFSRNESKLIKLKRKRRNPQMIAIIFATH